LSNISAENVNITAAYAPKYNGFLSAGDEPTGSCPMVNVTLTVGGQRIEPTAFYSAKIGDNYYVTITDAVVAAEQSGDTIALIKDIELDKSVEIAGKNITIDGKGFSVTVKDVASGYAAAAFDVKDGAEVTFKIIDITGGSVVDENGAIAEGKAGAAINATTGATVNVVDANLVGGSAAGVSMPSASAAIKANGATIDVSDSALTSGKAQEMPAPVIDIEDTSKLSLDNTVLNYTTTGHPYFTEEIGVVSGTVGAEYNTPIDMSGKIVINGRTFDSVSVKVPVGETLSLVGDIDTDTITLESGYDFSKTAAGFDVVEATESAEEIYVLYREIEDNIDENKTYEIVLRADEGDKITKINELATADLTLDVTLTPENEKTAKMSYSVLPADNFTMSQTGNEGEEHRYMFNYDGINKWEETDYEIVIGYVTIKGYGSFKLGSKSSDNNIVNATTLKDNLVNSYTEGGAATEGDTIGGLVINKNSDTLKGNNLYGVINGEVKIPERTLTINIDFHNDVEKKDADYQQMTVKLDGGKVKNKEIKLGGEVVDETLDSAIAYPAITTLTDKGYKVEIDLPYNTEYVVTVEGAGYRTARYGVDLTADKTLNFWNNVMSEENKATIEAGKVDGIKVASNFLAGDIVKDSQINIYDLSAVVSYFGTVDCVKSHPEYAKYDLNRDGVIDSKDVAYVLVSWGK